MRLRLGYSGVQNASAFPSDLRCGISPGLQQGQRAFARVSPNPYAV
jgi:hypothetical protein